MIKYKILSYGGEAGYEQLATDLTGHVSDGWHLVGNMCTPMCLGETGGLILIFSQMIGKDDE